MNKGLGLDELPQTEKLYLEALAKAYNNALSWDTQRLVLSIMSGVASYNVISMYIPGLTKYRYTVAYLHRLQFGRGGAPAPKQPTTSIRIDIKQLNRFISFITGPHLAQHLPFGQRQKVVFQWSHWCPQCDTPNDTLENCLTVHTILPGDQLQAIWWENHVVHTLLMQCVGKEITPGFGLFSCRGCASIWRSGGDVASDEWKCCRPQGMWEKNDRILKGVQTVPEGKLQGNNITFNPPLEYSIYPWVKRCGPALKTKNVRFLIPCLRNLTQNPTPFKRYMPRKDTLPKTKWWNRYPVYNKNAW